MPFNLLRPKSSKHLQLNPTTSATSLVPTTSALSSAAVNELVRSRDAALSEVRKRDETIKKLHAAKAHSDAESAEYQRRLREQEEEQRTSTPIIQSLKPGYGEMDSLQRRCRDLEIQLQSLHVKEQQHVQEVNQLQSYLHYQESEIQQWREERERQAEELKRKHKEKEAQLTKQLHEKESMFKTQEAQLKKYLPKLEASYQNSQRKEKDLRVDFDRLAQQLLKSQAEIKHLKADLALHIELLQDKESSAADLRRVLKDTTTTVADLGRRIREVSGQAAERLQQNRASAAEIARLQPFEEETQHLRPQIGELRDRLRESQRARQETQEQLRSAQAQDAVRVQRFAYVQQALIESIVEKKRDQVDAEALQSFRNQLKPLRTALNECNAQNEKLKAEAEILRTSQKHMESLKKALDQSKVEKETLRRDVEKLFSL